MGFQYPRQRDSLDDALAAVRRSGIYLQGLSVHSRWERLPVQGLRRAPLFARISIRAKTRPRQDERTRRPGVARTLSQLRFVGHTHLRS